MKYFANSVLSHIVKKVKKLQKGNSACHRMLIMIPAMPEKHLLSIADALASHCLADSTTVLTLKIAKVLTDGWTAQGHKRAEDQGWLDDRGNLTYYRNLAPIGGKLSLIILCGVDRVTDSAGLADFHTCDLDIIWRSEMGRSFQGWVNKKLQSIGIHSVEVEELKTFDRLLKPLLDLGRGDLLQISDWLENFDLNHVGNVHQVQQAMLARLDYFGLPAFTKFPLRQKKKTLAPYIDKAGSFFSYTLFLEARERDKAKKTIDKIIEALHAGEDPRVLLEDEDVRGLYSCGEEFLGGLKNYILTDDKEDRERLLKCDFVTILDKILKYRKKETPEKKESLRKVSGSPVEMLLTAVWQSMRDFYRDKFVAPDAQVSVIEIKSDCFKHDDESVDGEESDTVLDSTELAREYLARLIGGLDSIVSKHLSLSDIDGNEINVKSSLVSDDIPCRYSRTAEPQLEFSVYISYGDGAVPFRRKFAWRLPENHSYRLSEALLYRVKEAMGNHEEIWKLPVFHLPYYDELLRASSDDEIRRVLLHCVRDEDRLGQKFFINLLSEEWLKSDDSLLPKLKILAEKYHLFIRASVEQGLLGALFNGTEWTDLRRSYSDACREVADNADALQSPSAGMLLRSFLILPRRAAGAGVVWHADPYEQSGIVTILHPALIEMLEAQILYLFSCFNYAVNKEIECDSRRESFKPHIWRTYVDLSEIQAPLSGLLYNEEQNLDTSVRGQELIHRIGSPAIGDATLSTRLLLTYGDNNDDEEVFSDSEMFRETSESKLLLRLMLDYFRLHPHARDGLSIAVFRNKDIQPVIAAVHHYLSILANPKEQHYYVLPPDRRRSYAISVTIFTESSDDADVSRWIEQWRERWEAAETESKYQAYRECRFAVAHRLVEKGGQGSFQRLINDNFEADIAVFYDFIGAGSGVNRFENVPPFDITTRTLKFPILEKACCTIRNPAEQYKRARVISNRQFSLGAQHANLMHCLKNKSQQTGTIVVGTGDFTQWRTVIDALHAKTEWVICIDPNMDERLVKKPSLITGLEREIIGFGSGVGTHGEDNYTISTEQFSLSDVHARLCASIESLYAGAGWSADECQEVASGVLKVARELSGLSLVRATGVDDQYIRDFMAYALSRKILRADGLVLCDNLISLDAYRHWFDLAENARRPDLMWLKAQIGQDNRLHLDIHFIECKMAQQSEELLVKARSQINNGLRVLMPAFAPIAEGQANIEDYRPDRRYWWMQLHRLIASKTEIDRGQHAEVLSALERLAEGDYDVTWSAAVFAFWINSGETNIKRIGHWTTGISNDVTASIYAIGSQLVKHLAIGSQDFPICWSELQTRAEQVVDNVCENMEDIELPPGEDEDDDTTKWEEDDATPDDENGGGTDFENMSEDSASGTDIDYADISDAQQSTPIEIQAPQGPVLTDAESISTPSVQTEILEVPQAETSSEGLSPQPSKSQVVLTSSKMPERILLGTTINGHRPVYWEFGHTDLANRHMLIFGTSGMGKTYAIQCLLCEMARAGQNSLVVDYTDGFIPSKVEPSARSYIKNEGQNFILNAPLPINPFRAQVSYEAGMEFKDTPITIAKRVSAIFKSVYELGNQQFPILIDAITEGVEQDGDRFDLNKLQEMLQSFIGDGIHSKGSVQTTISKLKPFISSNPFASDKTDIGWNEIFSKQDFRNRVFQFHKVDKHSARALIEFVLWDLYAFVTSCGRKEHPRVVVLDEVQNLDLGPDAPVAKYLTEGRKHGLALITATQTVRGVGGVSDARVSRLFQADQKLFFKPTENEMREHAQLLHNAVSTVTVQEWASRLASLQKGECWALGRNLNETTGKLMFQAQRIKITSLEERGFNG